MRRYPQSRFCSPMWTTRSSTEAAVGGRPGRRWPLPSYFCAINRWCQRSSVSGVTIVANSASTFRPSPFALAANRRQLVVGEPQPPLAELLTQHPVLLAQVFDHLKLALIHPTGNSDQDKAEWIQNGRHLLTSVSAPSEIRGPAPHIQKDPVSGP